MNQIPKLSSSLILCRRVKNRIDKYDYQILFIRRSSSVNFPNAYAFPGGVYQESDTRLSMKLDNMKIEKQDWIQRLKMTSLRETFEELGIVLVDAALKS